MDSRTLFLDTNVYLGYALDDRFEYFHPECCIIFRSARARHTSDTVRNELRTKESDRTKLYSDFVKHIESGNPPEQFNCQGLKESDQNHVARIVELFTKKRLSLEYFRLLGTELKEGILNGLGKTNKPYVKQSGDDQMKSHFKQAVGIHPPDNTILTDFFDWAFPRSGSIFITGDGEIHKKKAPILKHVSIYKGNCTHLDVQFVTEAASKLR